MYDTVEKKENILDKVMQTEAPIVTKEARKCLNNQFEVKQSL